MSFRILEILVAGFVGGFAFWLLDSIRSRGWRWVVAALLPRRLARRLRWWRDPVSPPLPELAGADVGSERRSSGGVDTVLEPPEEAAGTGAVERSRLRAAATGEQPGSPSVHETLAVGPPARPTGLLSEITVQQRGARHSYTVTHPVTLIGGSERADVPIPGARATAVVERLEDVALVRAVDEDAPVWLGGRRVGTQPVPITSSNAVLDVQPASIVVASLAARTPTTGLHLAWIDERPPGLVVRELPGRAVAVWGDVDPTVLSEMAAAALDTLVPHRSGPTWALRVALGCAPPRSDVGLVVAVTDDDEDRAVCRLAVAGRADIRRQRSPEEPWTALRMAPIDGVGIEPLSAGWAPIGQGEQLGVDVDAAGHRVRVDLSASARRLPAATGR